MAWLWSSLVVAPLIALSTIFHGTVAVVVSFFDAHGRKQLAVARVWAQSLVVFTGAKVTVEGLEHIESAGRYVFVANHLSYTDTPVVLSRIPVQFRFLAKEGLFQIPFMGTHLKSAGHIPVPRDDPRAAVRTLGLAAQSIRSHGISVLIFAEGGRSQDGSLGEFKDGAAYIAIKAQAPLVPIALSGTRELLPFGSGVFRSGPVRLVVGEPIPTAGMQLKARRRLTEMARERILEMLESPTAPAGLRNQTTPAGKPAAG